MIKKSIISGLVIYMSSIIFGMVLSRQLTDMQWFGREVMKISAGKLLAHNIISNCVSLLGLISFGIITIIYLIYNGIILGITMSKGSIYMIFTKILPHGVFEIVGTILIASIGLLPIWFVWHKYNNKDMNIDKYKIFKIFGAALGLLLIAAIIEANLMQ